MMYMKMRSCSDDSMKKPENRNDANLPTSVADSDAQFPHRLASLDRRLHMQPLASGTNGRVNLLG